MIVTLIIGLAVLSVIVMAHELGHFITAKAAGVRVDEFGLGFPPRLLSIKRGETRYSLNAIPFGGFNKLAGEEDPTVPRSLASKGIGTRLLILSAGSIMNILLPFVLFSIAFMVPHTVVMEPIVVKAVALGSPAARAGIQAGDTILSINEKPLQNLSDLKRYIQLNLGEEVAILVKHSDSTTEAIRAIPRWKPPQGQGAIGIEMDIEAARSDRTITSQSYPPWKAIPLAMTEFVQTFVLYKNGIFSTRKHSHDSISLLLLDLQQPKAPFQAEKRSSIIVIEFFLPQMNFVCRDFLSIAPNETRLPRTKLDCLE